MGERKRGDVLNALLGPDDVVVRRLEEILEEAAESADYFRRKAEACALARKRGFADGEAGRRDPWILCQNDDETLAYREGFEAGCRARAAAKPKA